ncbi:site-specific integrase [Marinobacter halotolerans]|uniref:tyrosine-type recombinase/integrase n=1 Tax=Marinobacter halotolerans TaxID=1569211 RepID=UPI001247BF40|nr:tyrosine-type recombinase/integrase [Marinobacter halotolerans]
MKVQAVWDSIKSYKQLSTALIALHLEDQLDKRKADAAAVSAIREIMNLEVSSASRFEDQTWYFPEAREKAAKTLASTRFTVAFDNYQCIPKPIIFQVKLTVLMAMLLPRSEIAGGDRKHRPMAVQTVVPLFRSWLSYMNHVFSRMNHEFSSDVVGDNFQSLEAVKRSHFVEFSEGFKTSTKTARVIERVFAIFQSKRVHELLFAEHCSFPKLRQTKAVVTEAVKDGREKVLSDLVCEKASAISGYIIADFLKKLDVEVTDQKSTDLMRNFPFELGSVKLLDVDWATIDTYAALRLFKKKYPFDVALQHIDPSNLLTNNHKAHSYETALREHFADRSANIDTLSELNQYLNLVHKAATYMVGQYTGMRPSELIEVRLDTPLQDSFGVPCIVSSVRKHQGSERALFDDKWVCIPAMVDALNAARIVSRTRANPFLFSKAETVAFGQEPSHLSQKGIKHILHEYFKQIVPEEYESESLYPYVLRHTLAYQLFRADLGLPFISHQLKHFGNLVGAFSVASNKGFSEVTLGYGDIGEKISSSTDKRKSLRHKAEIDAVKASYDPDAAYAGTNADEHSERMIKIFQGYQAAGYSKEEIFEAMAEQGMAITNVGTGMCYGGKAEDFDESLPCIGGLRCNPVRCKNAVVTEAHIPKWREVYTENLKVVDQGEDGPNYEQALEGVNEARMVLGSLGALK